MKMIMDDDAIEAIVSMLMELQEQDNTNIPLYERQLQETNTKIRNLINAIQQGVLTKSTKESLEELEAAKEELETRLANEQLSKPPKISAEFMTFWLHRFRKLDVTKQSHRKMLILSFFALPLTAGTGAISSPLTIGAVSILLPPPRLNREQNTLQIFFQREYHILFWIQVIPKIGWNSFIQMKKVRHNNENCIGICQSNR